MKMMMKMMIRAWQPAFTGDYRNLQAAAPVPDAISHATDIAARAEKMCACRRKHIPFWPTTGLLGPEGVESRGFGVGGACMSLAQNRNSQKRIIWIENREIRLVQRAFHWVYYSYHSSGRPKDDLTKYLACHNTQKLPHTLSYLTLVSHLNLTSVATAPLTTYTHCSIH